MFHRFFAKIEQGQNSSKLCMPICFFFVFLLIFFQMLTLTLTLKSSQFYQSWVRVTARNQGQRLGSGLQVEVRVNPDGQGYCLGFRASIQVQRYILGLALTLSVRVSVQVQGYCLGLVLTLSVQGQHSGSRVISQGQRQSLACGLALRIRLELRSRYVRVSTVRWRSKKTISTFEINCMNRQLNQVNEQCLRREVERFANQLRQ